MDLNTRRKKMTKEEILKDDWVANNYGDRARNWIDPAFLDGVEWMENQTDGKALLYAVKKTAERTKREMFLKVADWLGKNLYKYAENIRITRLISDIKQAMEE